MPLGQDPVKNITEQTKDFSDSEFEKVLEQIAHTADKEKNKPGADQIDGRFNLLSDLAESAQEEFEELIGKDSDKKKFIKAFTKILALLLNTNVSGAEKVQRILKITVEKTLKIWQRPR